MPRGNTKDNRTKSPIIGDSGVNATPDDLRKLTRYALKIFEHEKPDLNNPEEVRQSILEYFSYCDINGIRPANLGVYAYLGMSKQDVSDVLRGANKSKVNPACVDLLKKCKVALSSYREGLAMNGKVNPVTALFWAKNFDGMADTQTIEIQTDRTDAMQLTQEDINKRIPVYSDVEGDE